MLYLPYATRESLGLNETIERQVGLQAAGQPNAHMIVPVKDWSTAPGAAPSPDR